MVAVTLMTMVVMLMVVLVAVIVGPVPVLLSVSRLPLRIPLVDARRDPPPFLTLRSTRGLTLSIYLYLFI